jgi:hypothetical protein
MSNSSDDIFSYRARMGQTCRMAYTINNLQPVRCSFISDQPLFYMDFEGDFEEEGVDDFAIAEIENGIVALQQKIEALDSFSERFETDEGLRFQEFMEDAAAATSPIRETASIDTGADIGALQAELRKSRMAAEMLRFGKQYGTALHYNDQVGTAFYDRRDAQIYMNPRLAFSDQLLLAGRELRRMWQHRNGAQLHPLTFHPDQAVLVNRAQIADLSVMMVRTAWELQLAGNKEVWERLENASMSDLARAFAREAYLDFRTLNNGIASSAVFETWFLSERCRNEDRKLIQQMLADYRGYVFDSETSSRKVSADLVIALGSMPFGKNYLAPYVTTILSDVLFTEVRDRSNANFLWFIKFEKSFRETEQELQETGGSVLNPDRTNTPAVSASSQDANNKKRPGAHAQENIITLRRQGSPTMEKRAVAAGTRGADIIDFRGPLMEPVGDGK